MFRFVKHNIRIRVYEIRCCPKLQSSCRVNFVSAQYAFRLELKVWYGYRSICSLSDKLSSTGSWHYFDERIYLSCLYNIPMLYLFTCRVHNNKNIIIAYKFVKSVTFAFKKILQNFEGYKTMLYY